ncbi:MAG: hypothetical protein WBL54_09205 [Nitrososphaeraceae archaeon]
MQKVTWDHTFENVQKGLLDEIEATEKRIHPVHSTTFNNSMQNKMDLAKQILRLMKRSKDDAKRFVVSDRVQNRR